jgi:hypothetical protein
MGTMFLFVIIFNIIMMLCAGRVVDVCRGRVFVRILRAGGRAPYKYFLLDKLYNLLYGANAVTPCKSTTYSARFLVSPPPPLPPICLLLCNIYHIYYKNTRIRGKSTCSTTKTALSCATSSRGLLVMDYHHIMADVRALDAVGSGASAVPAQPPAAVTKQAPFTPVPYIIPENNLSLTFNLYRWRCFYVQSNAV